jgi:cytochrome c2
MAKYAALALMVCLASSLSVAALGADAKRGEELYGKHNCKACHSIAGVPAKNKFPLDGAGARLTAELMMKWIRTPQEMKKGTTMPTFPAAKISDTDLADIVAYLLTLKK